MFSPEVERLYTASFGHLSNLALQDQRLTPQDAYDCLVGLAKRLDLYTGPWELVSFQHWAAEVLMPSVFLHGTIRECRTSVRSALRKTLSNADFDDRSAVVDELEGEVWLWVLGNLNALRQPGTATLRTRLFARACWTARAWNKKQLLRWSAVNRRFETEGSLGQIETLSRAEIVEMKNLEEAA